MVAFCPTGAGGWAVESLNADPAVRRCGGAFLGEAAYMEARKKLGEILLDAGSITKSQLDEALREQVSSNDRLGELLVAKGVLTPQQVTEALGLQFMYPVVNVRDYFGSISAVNSLPRDLRERLGVFPLELQSNGTVLLVAISDPLNNSVQDELRISTPLNVKFALATEEDIQGALISISSEAVPPPPSEPAPLLYENQPVLLDSIPAEVEFVPVPEPPVELEAEPEFVPEQPVLEVQPIPPEPPIQQAPPVQQIVQPLQPQPVPQPPAQSVAPLQTGNILDMMRTQPKLGDILIQAGAITETQLTESLKRQKLLGKRLGEILVSENFISETKLAEALSTQLKLPMFTLTRYRPMPEAIKSVPRHISERLQLIPLSIVEGDLLLIAMANPLDLLAQDEVRMLTGRDIKVGITTLSEIQNNLDRLYNLQDNLEEAIVEIYGDADFVAQENITEASADDAPVIQLVSNVLEQAVREGASDVHVEPYEKTARIRYRVDGALYTAFDYPVALHAAVSARLKIMGGMDIAERRKPQDGRILIRVARRRIDLRVNTLPTLNGEKIVLRILDQESSAVGLERLGL
jgi:hypothetical protein